MGSRVCGRIHPYACVCVCVCACVCVCVKTSVLAWRQSNQPSCQQTPNSLICTNGNSVSLHKRVRLCVHGRVCVGPTSPDCLRFLFGPNRPVLCGTHTSFYTHHELWDGERFTHTHAVETRRLCLVRSASNDFQFHRGLIWIVHQKFAGRQRRTSPYVSG